MFLFKNDCTVLLLCEYLLPWYKQLQAVLAKYLPLLTHFIMREAY